MQPTTHGHHGSKIWPQRKWVYETLKMGYNLVKSKSKVKLEVKCKAQRGEVFRLLQLQNIFEFKVNYTCRGWMELQIQSFSNV